MPAKLTMPAPDFPVLEIAHPAATARVALRGAHVMEWTPAGQPPVLYLSPEAVFRPDKAIRGGIPLCWPWFGPAGQPGLPSHGFARTSLWTLGPVRESADGVQFSLTLADSPETRALWPHAFRLTLNVSIGHTLSLALCSENTGPETMALTGALHTYLRTGDVRHTAIHGLDGAEYLDESAAGHGSISRQSGPVRIEGEVDRDYAASGPVRLEDPGLQRSIHLTGRGSACTVVWNPWIEKARALSDLPDDGYLDFVCIETANAWQDRITLAPGAQHTLGVEIAVEALG